MKFLIKLMRVFLIILIILITGYIIDERDNIFFDKYRDDIHSTELNMEEKEDEVSQLDSYEDSSVDEVPYNEIHESFEFKKTKSNQNEEPSMSSFTYDMEAIDKHSIGHLHEMQKIITEFISSPHNNLKDLYNKLYTKNFMHLEEELEEKNQHLYNYMIALIESVDEHNNFSDSTLIVSNLDHINIILDNIIKIE